MSDPVWESLAGAGAAVFVPRRVTGPVLAGVVPGQPPAVVHRAAELAYTLNVKLICAYVDVTSYLADEPNDGLVDDAEATSAGIRERLENTLDGTGVRWSFRTLSGDPARALGQFAEAAGLCHRRWYPRTRPGNPAGAAARRFSRRRAHTPPAPASSGHPAPTTDPTRPH